jgi:hypothetical protein
MVQTHHRRGRIRIRIAQHGDQHYAARLDDDDDDHHRFEAGADGRKAVSRAVTFGNGFDGREYLEWELYTAKSRSGSNVVRGWI